MKINHVGLFVLLMSTMIGLTACGGGDSKQPSVDDELPITDTPAPTPEPIKKGANHSVKGAKLGSAPIQKSSSGKHDISATLTITNQESSSENFKLENAAIN